MCSICFSFIYTVTSKVKGYFCQHKPDINKVNKVTKTKRNYNEKLLKLRGSSVDNSAKSTQILFKDGSNAIYLQDPYPSYNTKNSYEAAVMPSSSVKTILFWRKCEFYMDIKMVNC